MASEIGDAFDSLKGEIESEEMTIADMDSDEVLDQLDKDQIRDYIDLEAPTGDIVLRIPGMEDREKLRRFLETEIFTSCREQEANINF